jgi:hypothetical protein
MTCIRIERPLPNDRSLEQMERVLRNEARLRLLEQTLGVSMSGVRSRTVVERMQGGASADFSDVFLEITRQEIGGRIVRDTAVLSGPSPVVWIELAAEIAREGGTADPGFSSDVRLNRVLFVEHDSILATLTTSRRARLYLFSVNDRGNARLLWPNPYDTLNVVVPDQERMVPQGPSPAYTLIAERDAAPGAAAQAELLWLIAHRGEGQLFDPREAFVRPYSVESINATLLKVPRNLRSEAHAAYGIVPAGR